MASGELLAVRGVVRRFGGIVALRGVDLHVDENECVSLVGPNGAGKTTLFDCVSGVTRPDAGQIFFGGKRIDHLPVYKRARLGIGRTFQRAELFAGLTPREHLLTAERARRGDGRLWRDLVGRGTPRAGEQELVDAVIEELSLGDVADAPIESLSLGQGRLVELGRALIGQPRLLLLDEPSSGLDSRETMALAAVLTEVRARRRLAILLVEHDLELVRSLSGRVVVLDFGRLIAEGSLADVMADPAVIRSYLGETVA